MSDPIRIAVVGIGKIARDQHLPSLAANPRYQLAACVSRSGGIDGVETFTAIEDMLAARPDVEVVSLCTPPLGRYALARAALDAGRHVMLEKPPGATVREIEDLATRARDRGVTLFASWHSRAAPAVAPAKAWLAGRTIKSVRIDWLEDVRRWHPGQAWIWEPTGLGVFDPGINALSVITAIMPRPLFVTEAKLAYPANRAMPIAAELALTDAEGVPVAARFDWRQTGEQTWTIRVDTTDGEVLITGGGEKLSIAGAEQAMEARAEYPGLYRQFASLVDARAIDVDLAPFQLVADAFMLGRREQVEAFED